MASAKNTINQTGTLNSITTNPTFVTTGGSSGTAIGDDNLLVGFVPGVGTTTGYGARVNVSGYSVNWGFYNNSAANNYFGTGLSGFNKTAPLAEIHAGAGTTTIAPLILDPGTLLTSPVNGAIETTSTHIYGTVGGTRYQLDQQVVSNFIHTIFTPTTGGTVNLVNNQYNIINPAGALLALTVNLPSSPANNDVVYIKFTQTISTVTYGNGTVVDGITAPTAGGLTVLVYDSGTTSWY